jgi:lipoic acid synthetase
LGEKEDEVIAVFKELRQASCDLLSIGQYLAPSSKHYSVVEYIHPDQFKSYERIALSLGFKHVKSGPYVRSSYMAEEYLRSNPS